MQVFVRQLQRLIRTISRILRVQILCVLGLITAACTITPPEVFIDHAPQSLVLESVDYTVDERGRLLVPVLVNGEGPFDFIVDTASSRTLIFENVRKALGLEFIEDRTTFVHGAILSQRRPVLPVREFRIGTLILAGADSFSLPDPITTTGVVPGGVLGMDFLKDYALFVSVTEQNIHFGRSGFTGKSSQYVNVPITTDDFDILATGLPFIPAAVQGKKVQSLFDLGSEATIANWPAADIFGFGVRRILSRDKNFSGILSSVAFDARMDAATILIGERVWTNQRIDVSNLPIFKTLNRADEPTLIVSATLLKDQDMVVDFPAGTLWLRAGKEDRGRKRTTICAVSGGEIVSLQCDATRFD